MFCMEERRRRFEYLALTETSRVLKKEGTCTDEVYRRQGRGEDTGLEGGLFGTQGWVSVTFLIDKFVK